ncbi:sensor histidine kinase [Mariniblastus fucicola]|uniref:sensor histidine kinase n=1 Tax=Mariniblastus fucicola TaxID=980251 RepID=UPI0011DFB141|nr:HAMP domain-containing sensor histidine kinase [Mariniblastus fucicola]
MLKTELRGPQGQRISASLPCPESQLTQWIAASQNRISSDKLAELIRSNPSLLLIAISRAVDCSGAPIQSMVQLLSRLDHCFCESNAIDTALGHVVDVQTCSADSFEWDTDEAVENFFRAKNRKQLAKSLSKFVRVINKHVLPKNERPRKSAVKTLIESMFVESFRVHRIKPSNSKWPDTSASHRCDDANAAVVGLLSDRLASKKQFEAKLLDAKLAAMKQLAYGASHEINNPLANVATRAHTMLAEETDPDRRFQLAVMHEQAMRAHDMISDMMLFAHPPELRVESVDVRLMVSKLIRECEANLLPLIRSGASVTAMVADRIERATFDPTQIKVVLACLIQNAAEAIRHDDGEIEIRISRDDGMMCFSVSDNGVGISEEVQQHLFDPFYSGREAGRGLGFGLSKSWRIANLHGGSLTHRVDAGDLRTVFDLRLPLE